MKKEMMMMMMMMMMMVMRMMMMLMKMKMRSLTGNSKAQKCPCAPAKGGAAPPTCGREYVLKAPCSSCPQC